MQTCDWCLCILLNSFFLFTNTCKEELMQVKNITKYLGSEKYCKIFSGSLMIRDLWKPMPSFFFNYEKFASTPLKIMSTQWVISEAYSQDGLQCLWLAHCISTWYPILINFPLQDDRWTACSALTGVVAYLTPMNTTYSVTLLNANEIYLMILGFWIETFIS